VKPPAFDYVRARDVAHAVALLEAHGGDAVPLAGGQSLMPALNFRLAAPALLIDLNAIAPLGAHAIAADGALVAGAMTRHRTFETSSVVERGWPLLSHAMAWIAHVAIRNRGTIGGSLCHADPSAEWPALCLACDAEIALEGPGGRRLVKAADFAQGLFTTARAPDELLVEVRFPAWPPGRRWGFREVARRRGDFAVAGVACLLEMSATTCTRACIVAFGVADAPQRSPAAEAVLVGRDVDVSAIRTAAAAAHDEIDCRADPHAGVGWRRELVRTLTERTLADAMARQPPP